MLTGPPGTAQELGGDMYLWQVSNASMAPVPGPLDCVSRDQAPSRDMEVTCSVGLGAVGRKGLLELWQPHPHLGLGEVMVDMGLSRGRWNQSLQQSGDTGPTGRGLLWRRGR